MNYIHQIPNDSLTLPDIPSPDAGWKEIEEFALTFDGYHECGSFEKCADIANSQQHDSLYNLRVCLFFEQRRWRHFCEDPDEDAMGYIRDLVKKIRARLMNEHQS